VYTYVYDNEDIILEYLTKSEGRESRTEITRYLHGPGVDEPLGIEQKGRTYFYHADALGSISTLTDERQKNVQSYEYTSFGELRQRGNSVKQPYTYTGREWDKEIGLYFYRARYYDPSRGRFLKKDPVGFMGGVNHYSYVENNPIIHIDPTGLFSVTDAIIHYFIGEGEVTLSFSEVDIGLQPSDFEGYTALVRSMYRREGTLDVDLRTVRDIGGWAGHQTYRLKGTITSCACNWTFSGSIGAYDNPFDFDALPWGTRDFEAELITRFIDFYGPHFGGRNYNITFMGHRAVSDGGAW